MVPIELQGFLSARRAGLRGGDLVSSGSARLVSGLSAVVIPS